MNEQVNIKTQMNLFPINIYVLKHFLKKIATSGWHSSHVCLEASL